MAERIVPHQKSFGYKAIWSHEFAFKTWREDPPPMIEAVRGLATDYDYRRTSRACATTSRREGEALEGVEGGDLQAALERSLSMNPLTPDHHFYIDQGTNARLRILLVAIGEKLVEPARSTTPRT